MKNISKYLWFSFIPYTVLGLTAIVLISMSIISSWYLISTLVGWTLISGLGIAVGYHRIFSHNCYDNLPRWKENIILFCGALGGQGSSITWASIHRGYHHRWSDSDRDLHSPSHGIWHAFLGWAVRITESNPVISLKFAGPILRKSNHLWLHNNYYKTVWLITVVVALIDWKLSLTLLCLPAFLSLLQDNLVNIIGHKKSGIGYRNYPTNDNSHNNAFAYITWGQCWHNNHHYDPASFDFGSAISGKWWEVDPSNIFKPFLGAR